jgi:hypothetical protein
VETKLTHNTHEYGQCLFGLAGEYLEAAEVLHDCRNAKWLPMYYLICHSLELSLKSFLSERGYDEKRLKGIGHSIKKCLVEAEGSGLRFSIPPPEANELLELDEHYTVKSLEYFYDKSKIFPNAKDLITFTKHLRSVVFNEITLAEFHEMR